MNRTDSHDTVPSSTLPRRSKLRGWPFYVVAIVLFFSVVLLKAVYEAREDARRSQCKGHYGQISLALRNYHYEYGSFPPAYIADANGRPMHSWRVLILPYIDQPATYQNYRFDEPWDGPNNRQLADAIPLLYKCPSDERDPNSPARYHTNYVAIVGPDTIWPGEQPLKFDDAMVGISNPLFVVEVANSGIHWMEPRDLHIVQMSPEVNPAAGQGISSKHKEGANVLYADGRSRFLPNLPAGALREQLTRHGND